MNKIDISKWHEFQLGGDYGLFEIVLPSGDIQAQKMDDGNYPLISSGKNNNGICKYIDETSESEKIQANTITIDMFGKAFYHNYEYYCVSHGRVNILIPKFNITQNIGLYIAKVIESVTIPKYEFLDMCSQGALIKESIKLPINKQGEPDWEYMESYMKNIMQEAKKNIENLQNISNTKKKINLNTWKSFKIGKLFNEKIIKPSVLHTKDVTEDINGIPYVVRTKFDNGIKYNVEKKPKMKTSPAGTISFGAENATFFYQENEYVSGRDIYYIDTRHLSKYACLFLVTCLQTITEKYPYNYGMFPELVKKEEIKLPVDKNGEPDWEYMENYMKNIMKDTTSKLDKLVCC